MLGHSLRYGYGCVNAFEAVKKAKINFPPNIRPPFPPFPPHVPLAEDVADAIQFSIQESASEMRIPTKMESIKRKSNKKETESKRRKK
jgi:hypothetical protein